MTNEIIGLCRNDVLLCAGLMTGFARWILSPIKNRAIRANSFVRMDSVIWRFDFRLGLIDKHQEHVLDVPFFSSCVPLADNKGFLFILDSICLHWRYLIWFFFSFFFFTLKKWNQLSTLINFICHHNAMLNLLLTSFPSANSLPKSEPFRFFPHLTNLGCISFLNLLKFASFYIFWKL